MNKTAGSLLLSGFLFSSMAVPLFNGELSAGYIKQDPEGWVKYKGTPADVDTDLKIGSESSFFVKGKLEHPIPLLPNVKLQYVRMNFSGDGEVQDSFTFGDITVAFNEKVKTKLDMDHYDFILFYNMPIINILPMVDVEFGLNVRVIDFYAEVQTSTAKDSVSFTAPIPMLHGSIELKPVGFVSFLLESNIITFQGSSYYDLAGEVRFKPLRTLIMDLFIGIGYKYERLKIDDIEDVSTDIKIKQPYIAAGVLF